MNKLHVRNNGKCDVGHRATGHFDIQHVSTESKLRVCFTESYTLLHGVLIKGGAVH